MPRFDLILAAGLTLAAGCVPPAGTATPRGRAAPPAPRATADPEVRELVRLVNDRRGARGCPRLIWDERLAAVARRHSEDMARRGYFSHVNPDGKDPFERMRDAGIDYRAAAENIAEGYTDARRVYDGWISSRGHRANLENCMYTHHGIGVHHGRWTHLFARYSRTR